MVLIVLIILVRTYLKIYRTYAFLPFLSFPSPIRSRASYGGNPVFGRFLTPWIPIPRLREDELHGNDTDCVSPNIVKMIIGVPAAYPVFSIFKIHLQRFIGITRYLNDLSPTPPTRSGRPSPVHLKTTLSDEMEGRQSVMYR